MTAFNSNVITIESELDLAWLQQKFCDKNLAKTKISQAKGTKKIKVLICQSKNRSKKFRLFKIYDIEFSKSLSCRKDRNFEPP